ncbi:hypothetical protein [Sulfitobacter sp. MF3-043]|uniref:hypothetical protein n=1 Tax=Sulfitobacter sediminivivens TaxID=3252902 RepID=UPI0036DBBEB4
MEKLVYFQHLLKRGYALATSSVFVLIPTAIIYVISTIASNQKASTVDFSEPPLNLIISVLDDIDLNTVVSLTGIVFFLIVGVKIFAIFFASEDIYRLRLGHSNNRYIKIMSLTNLLPVWRFTLAYLFWNMLFIAIAIFILAAVEKLEPVSIAWTISILLAAALFPVYYAGVSIMGFIFAAQRSDGEISDIRKKIHLNIYRIYLFYCIRGFVDLATMLGIPILVFRVVNDPVLYTITCILVLTPIILIIRTTSQYFKVDIFKPVNREVG